MTPIGTKGAPTTFAPFPQTARAVVVSRLDGVRWRPSAVPEAGALAHPLPFGAPHPLRVIRPFSERFRVGSRGAEDESSPGLGWGVSFRLFPLAPALRCLPHTHTLRPHLLHLSFPPRPLFNVGARPGSHVKGVGPRLNSLLSHQDGAGGVGRWS